MNIYVASSWRNAYQPAVVEVLRDCGHEVYDFRNPADGDRGFAWSALDPAWQEWTPEQYIGFLDDHRAVDGFLKDYRAMDGADVCVLVLPCGRSAHIEAGWFVGARKPLLIFYPEILRLEPELMYKLAHGVVTTSHALVMRLVEIERAWGGDEVPHLCVTCGAASPECLATCVDMKNWVPK